MRIPIAVTAVVALVAVAGPAEAAKKPCARKGSTTVKSSKLARVYEVPNKDGGSNLIGCLRSNDRRQVLARGYDDSYTSSGTYDQVKLAGARVKWRFTSVDDSCKADCPPGYQSTTTARYERNLRTRKTSEIG